MTRAMRTGWLLGVLLFGALPAYGQVIHRNGFETTSTAWVRSSADAQYEEKTHVITNEGAHDGLRCEFLRIDAGQLPRTGAPPKFIYYQYGIGKGPISEEFIARAWIKSNRPQVQLLARLILPNERDPSNLEYRMSTILEGEVYKNVGRWQQLEIPRPVQLCKAVQQKMQATLKREVNFKDAYVDSLVLNVYTGPGPTEVWIDDLETGPVTNAIPVSRPAGAKPVRTQVVEFTNNQLLTGGKKLFFRGVYHSNTPLHVLRDAGFNTLFIDPAEPAASVREAVDLGFWLAPRLQIASRTGQPTPSDELIKAVSQYSDGDAVLFYNMGAGLAREQVDAVTRAATAIHSVDVGRPLGADVLDSTLFYGRSVNLIGAHRFPLFTSMELTSYHDWLDQRRRLALPDTFAWTWVQTHTPETHTQLVFEKTGQDSFKEPVGPLPEQLRLMTYTALAAGYKGISFSSDRWLADSHQGRDRLLCCALLNQEIDMLEPLLLEPEGPPVWIDTSAANVKAAVIRTPKGALVLPIWMGRGSQYVPGQAAVAKLTMVVPQIPQTMQAWEVHPADVHSLRTERVTGGTKVTVPEFGLTTAIFFTADSKAVLRFQDQARARRQLAAQWSYDMAIYELEKMRKIHDQLVAQGHTLNEANHLLPEAVNRLTSAKELWEARNFGESYRESQRALRPMRIVMRAQWDRAVKKLDTPSASPYAVSFFSLPGHWQFMDQVERMTVTSNVLPGGDFEVIPQRPQTLWRSEEMINDEVDVQASRVTEVVLPPAKKGAPGPATEPPHEGKQCAMLQIKPRVKGPNAPTLLERTRIALVSSEVKLAPGTLVKISGWVRIPAVIKGSPDGALLYDSAGGEDLAVRFVATTGWKQYTLYRKVPASGGISVCLALTGMGTVYFDDVRIEPLAGNTATANANVPGK